MTEFELYASVKKQVADYIFRPDCNLLFSPHDGMEFKLNTTAVVFYNAVLSSPSLSDAIKFLTEEYSVSNDVIKADLLAFIESLTFSATTNQLKQFEDKQLEKKVAISQMGAPFSIEFELTKACNFKCPFCYNTWKHGVADKNGQRTHLSASAIMRVLDEAKQLKVFRIRYSGGEPTLYPNLNKIVSYAGRLGFFQSIFTNAYLLTNDVVSFWRDSNVNEVLVSLHGLPNIHDEITKVKGSFSRTYDNINVLLNAGIKVIVEMTLVSSNVNEVHEVLEKVSSLGVTEFRLMKYVPNGVRELDETLMVSDSSFQRIRESLLNYSGYTNRKINIAFPCSQRFCTEYQRVFSERESDMFLYNCRAGINWLAISYSGDVKICPHAKKAFGNILDHDFSLLETWKSGTSTEALRILQARDKSCKHCPAWTKCFGGCLLS